MQGVRTTKGAFPAATGPAPDQNNHDHSIREEEEMQQIPDAPWIRQAENWGPPPYDDDPEPTCPICGKECETIYTDKDGNAAGCEKCMTLWEAAEWQYENERRNGNENFEG